MLPKTLIKGFDKGRLRKLLALIVLALAVPTAVLIWQAYGQLKWESFHQYRGDAEELTRRIDTRLNAMIRTADARSFADYSFLVVSGDPSANFVQRSPLSAYPVTEDLPGVLGYFQVDTHGTFSTPLLPPNGTEAVSFGISEREYIDRLELAQEILTVLADNRLVQSRPVISTRRGIVTSFAALGGVLEEEKEADEYEYGALAATDKDDADGLDAKPAEPIVAKTEGYSQQIFDQLNQPRSDARAYSGSAGALELEELVAEDSQTEERLNRVGKVSEIRLDGALQKKSQDVERQRAGRQLVDSSFADSPGRTKRKEKIALPESARPADNELIRNIAGPTDLRISTFESEIDPFEFSHLDSGHFVLFRKVWRDGERYIQGLLVDQAVFTQDIIGARFADTTLSDMSNLIVAYEDDVIRSGCSLE